MEQWEDEILQRFEKNLKRKTLRNALNKRKQERWTRPNKPYSQMSPEQKKARNEAYYRYVKKRRKEDPEFAKRLNEYSKKCREKKKQKEREK